MVSRQETARPLLTPGEVMQLPPDEAVVMVSSVAPIKAKKLRYYADSNFKCRVLPPPALADGQYADAPRSEEHTSELQSLMRISYAVFCLKKTIYVYTLYHKSKRLNSRH